MQISEVNEGCTITSQPCICLYLLYQTHTINMVQSFPSKNKDMDPSFLWHPHFEWPSLMWTYAVANKDIVILCNQLQPSSEMHSLFSNREIL